jgi:hypothetical protein
MSESFQVIFNNQGANVINAANINAIQYNVSWGTFLPTKFKKFNCQFVFKSECFLGDLDHLGFVNLNFGRVNNFNGQVMSYNLGIIYPIVLYNNVTFYSSSNNDNNDFWIDYPSNNIVTIVFNRFDGVTALDNMQNYVLMLKLTGVDNDEIIKNNN